ncbi:PxKF domain-containing protein [Longivirga aurantiaca]|uniref:PxKF domain-containing protein n=1 Tax=Longivirga aurantiaca TaxID=1837743 RepID=A0ABW1T2I4_9ACTN
MRWTTVVVRGAVAAVVLAAAWQPVAAQAATFTISCLSNPVLRNIALIDALEKANDEVSYPGADTVVLPAGCHYLFDQDYGDSGGILPPITAAVTIDGNGSTIERQDPDTGTGDGGRFLTIKSTGDLVVGDLTLLNGAGSDGGFIGNSGQLIASDLVLEDSAYGNNDSALHNWGTAYVQRTTFTNTDLFGIAALGGGVYNEGGAHLTVVDSLFQFNTADAPTGVPQVGGALFNEPLGYVEIYGTTFDRNYAGGTGGAIYNAGDLRIHGSTFTGNGSNFGAAIDNSADLTVDTSYFGQNAAGIQGGAINSTGLGTLMNVTNSTFYRNSANSGNGKGGAIANGFSFVGEALTFDGNKGVGASVWTGENAVSRLESSILGGTVTQCAGDGTTNDFGGNLVQSSAYGCPDTFLVGDPVLSSPAAHGSTAPLTVALGAGSAAVDRISSGCTSTDQRGKPRPADACDIGAYENQAPSAPGTPLVTPSTNPTRTGAFQLSWSAASDPDGTAPCYSVQRKDTDDSAFTQIASTCALSTGFSAITAQAEGRVQYRISATDGLTTATGSTSSVLVIDRTAPSDPTLTPDRVAEYSPAAGDAWWADTLTVTAAGSSDPALADGSAGTGIAGYTDPQTLTATGATVVSGTATDGAGNTSTSQAAFRVDASAPVVAYGACPATRLKGQALTLAWSATDAGAGLATSSTGTQVVDVDVVGEKTYQASATDLVGHTTVATCTVRVVYDYKGPFSPLSATGYATVTAGRVVPVQFSLAGNQGLGVLTGGNAQSAPVTCGTTPALTSGTATSPTKAGLTYDTKTGLYTYSWKTASAWAGSCRVLILPLNDGTMHRSYVQFK